MTFATHLDNLCKKYKLEIIKTENTVYNEGIHGYLHLAQILLDDEEGLEAWRNL